MLEDLDPFGELRMDYRFAKLGSQIMLALGVKNGKTNKPYTPLELILEFKEVAPVKQTADQIEAEFRAFAQVHNARMAELGKGKGN